MVCVGVKGVFGEGGGVEGDIVEVWGLVIDDVKGVGSCFVGWKGDG